MRGAPSMGNVFNKYIIDAFSKYILDRKSLFLSGIFEKYVFHLQINSYDRRTHLCMRTKNQIQRTGKAWANFQRQKSGSKYGS